MMLPVIMAVVLFLGREISGGDPTRDPGRDPCKITDSGFGLTCSNITSQFFSSAMFFSLNDDIALFTGEIKRLEVQHSNVTHLSPGCFKYMPHLTYLIVGNVSLQNIDRGAFEGLTNLKMADLSNNDLREMPMDAFKDTRISHVNLEGNARLQVPTNGPILDAKRLRSLVLRKCGLQHLPGSAFSKTRALSFLDLGENELEMLPRDIFNPLKHLDFLDLSYNRFRTIDFAVFTSIPSYPKLPGTVVLTGNRWSCDCRIAGLIRWVTRNGSSDAWTSVATLSRLRKRTVCHEPDNMKGMSWNDVLLQKFIDTC